MELFHYVLIGVFIVLLLISIGLYNYLISKKNAVNNAYASINVYLKQRHDLIPNLVSIVKEYMKYEREVLEKITELRTLLLSRDLPDQERFKMEGELSRLLGKIFFSVENYPSLKANENFLHLQQTLNEVEEKIAAARRFYNSAVTDLNNALEMFPTNILGRIFKIEKRPWFEIDESFQTSPDLNKLFRT